MAAGFRLLVSVVNQKTAWHPFVFSFRAARFPAWHLTPVADEKEYEILKEEDKLTSYRVMPVKPAPNDFNISIFEDPVIKKFTNMVMMWSEKDLARKLMHETFANIKRIQLKKYHSASDEDKLEIECNPRVIFKQAVENCKPVMHLRPIKRGGITYQVPTPLTYNRARFMSMKWLIMAARDKDGPISFITQLTRELLDAYNYEGRVIRRKQELHRVCEANKAYAHYRWS